MQKKNNTILMPPLLVDPECEIYADEPVFNPDIHLALTEPDFVVLLDGFSTRTKSTTIG